MTHVGVTGHQRIPADVLDFVVEGLTKEVESQPRPVIGYSSLARGADQLFAEVLLAAGGELHAVLPCDRYESTMQGQARDAYFRLLSQATQTIQLPFPEPSEAAFSAAGKWIGEHSDILVAVWDGEEARGLGGTGDTVRHARQHGTPVFVIWPEGTKRN